MTRRAPAPLSLLVAAAFAAVTSCATRRSTAPASPQPPPPPPSIHTEILPSMTEEGDKRFTEAGGQTYVIRKLPKIEGRYSWIDGDTIRYEPFAAYDVLRQDEQFLYVKMYDAPEVPSLLKLQTPVPVAPPELATTSRFRLEPFDDGLPRQSQWRQRFDVGDMNGDARPDLVFTAPRDLPGPPVVFLNLGRGRWEQWRDASFPPMPYDYGAVTAADFDGNGALDLAIASHYRGVAVVLSDGRGSFRPFKEGLEFRRATAQEGPVAFSSRALVATDWNRDGRPDLAVLSDGPRPGGSGVQLGLTVYLNLGESWEKLRSATRDSLFGDAIAAGDLDADGAPDLVTASHSIGDAHILRLGSEGSLAPRPLETVLPRSVVGAVDLHDLNGDGRDEILLGYASAATNRWSVGIDIVSMNADGPSARRIWWEEGHDAISGIAPGDLDGDGAPDLVAVLNDGRLVAFRGDGQGFVTMDARLEPPEWRRGCSGSSVRLADLDGDKKDEIIASFAGERSLVNSAILCATGGGVEVWKVRIRQ